jgi:trehalose/maltose hydrolase-like predicted phosphorylase
MMLEITRFRASIAQFNPGRERDEIHGVMGPGEFHDKYPGALQGGLRNNAHTNVLVAWLRGIAGQPLPLLPASRAEALRMRLGIGDEELTVWQDMSRRMFIPFLRDGIISQFEGYEDLEELDPDPHKAMLLRGTFGPCARAGRPAGQTGRWLRSWGQITC